MMVTEMKSGFFCFGIVKNRLKYRSLHFICRFLLITATLLSLYKSILHQMQMKNRNLHMLYAYFIANLYKSHQMQMKNR